MAVIKELEDGRQPQPYIEPELSLPPEIVSKEGIFIKMQLNAEEAAKLKYALQFIGKKFPGGHMPYLAYESSLRDKKRQFHEFGLEDLQDTCLWLLVHLFSKEQKLVVKKQTFFMRSSTYSFLPDEGIVNKIFDFLLYVGSFNAIERFYLEHITTVGVDSKSIWDPIVTAASHKELFLKFTQYAANKGYYKAFLLLGKRHLKGDGVAKDFNLACDYYKNAFNSEIFGCCDVLENGFQEIMEYLYSCKEVNPDKVFQTLIGFACQPKDNNYKVKNLFQLLCFYASKEDLVYVSKIIELAKTTDKGAVSSYIKNELQHFNRYFRLNFNYSAEAWKIIFEATGCQEAKLLQVLGYIRAARIKDTDVYDPKVFACLEEFFKLIQSCDVIDVFGQKVLGSRNSFFGIIPKGEVVQVNSDAERIVFEYLQKNCMAKDFLFHDCIDTAMQWFAKVADSTFIEYMLSFVEYYLLVRHDIAKAEELLNRYGKLQHNFYASFIAKHLSTVLLYKLELEADKSDQPDCKEVYEWYSKFMWEHYPEKTKIGM